MRYPKVVVSFTGLALAALAACSESVRAPMTAPEASESKSSSAVVRGSTSSPGGIIPTAYSGNTSGDGSRACSALGFGSTGVKVDGAYSQKIGGYQFTVYGDGKTMLSFAPIGGTTPTTGILAVIVKGGPAYDVYDYTGKNITSDGGLNSPLNGGGNVPTISHYVVCYGPAPVPPVTPVFEKKLTNVYSGMIGSIPINDPNWSMGQTLVIPRGETRWLHYELRYTLPTGTTAVVSENTTAVCGTVPTGAECAFADWPAPVTTTGGVWTWSSNPYTTGFAGGIDIKNNGACGERDFKNTATLAVSNGVTTSASATVKINYLCH